MRLTHVTLPVRDLARSRAFYERFDLTLIVATDQYCRFKLDDESTLSIALHHGAHAAPGLEIGIEFDSAEALDARVEELKRRGFSFATETTDQSWLWRDARLHDPDGHECLLFFAGANKLDPPWKVRS
jgi:catechol 2,3-dioxygenase-like lactoylglutathione lyase family enzyme